MKFHPLAELFPLLEGDEFDALVESIRANGLREPITLFDGKILDGRNRYQACRTAKVEPKFRDYKGGSPLVFVIDLNLKRRHLTASQRAVLALEVLPLLAAEARKRQAHGKTAPGKTLVAKMPQAKSREAAAKLMGVSPRYVEQAKRVAKAAPGLMADLRSGAKTLTEAGRELRLAGKAEHVERIRGQVAAATTDIYPVLCADPPWQYEYAVSATRKIENQYPTLSTEQIKALKIPAHRDAVLFLWATSPKLTEALAVMLAWGFAYRTSLVWVKDGPIGMGYYARQRHELLLVGKRGELPMPDEKDRPDSVITAPRGRHSEKPDAAYELIARMYPSLTRVELFARGPRAGWATWGNEAV